MVALSARVGKLEEAARAAQGQYARLSERNAEVRGKWGGGVLLITALLFWPGLGLGG